MCAGSRIERRSLAAFGCSFKSLLPAAVLASALALPALAQQQALLKQGDAVVTGFSGATELGPPPKGANPVDFKLINAQGVTLQVFDLSKMSPASDDAKLVPAQRQLAVSAGEIGQVFGVALDDGLDAQGVEGAPNIYATATSVYGLQLLSEKNKVLSRTKMGGPDAKWMQGQFGVPLGGEPGSIWKIDTRTGAARLFANVRLDGKANSGPALGNIAFDRRSRRLFVSDLQTGMVHAFDLEAVEVGKFDHGTQGRSKQGLPPVAFNAAVRVAIASPAFQTENPATWGFAPVERQVWGLAVHEGRLFYAVASGPSIWSVGIGSDGAFGNDARLEIQVQAPSADPISQITFAADGTMYTEPARSDRVELRLHDVCQIEYGGGAALWPDEERERRRCLGGGPQRIRNWLRWKQSQCQRRCRARLWVSS